MLDSEVDGDLVPINLPSHLKSLTLIAHSSLHYFTCHLQQLTQYA
jgi:hypothetical protein